MLKLPFFLALAIILLIIVWGGTFYLGREARQNVLVAKIYSQKEETKLYKIKAEYPLFENSAKLNNEIKHAVSAKINKYKENATSNWQSRQEKGNKITLYPASPWPFTLSWTPAQLNKNYISFLITINSFEGGANENQELMTFNYDLKNNRTVGLADLFPGNANYLNTVSDYVKKDLISQYQSNNQYNARLLTDFIEVGAAPSLENFSHFTFDDLSVTFYFPKGIVAPAVFGEQKVIMPR